MRRLFVFLMIVLLPLRGWAGDLMSVRMALGSPAVQTASMPSDCPMHAQADTASHEGASSGDGTHSRGGMGNCSSCELCIPLAQLAVAPLDMVSFAAHAEPRMGGVDFMSVAPAPAFKPPIS